MAALDAAWSGAAKKNVVTIVAWGGTGKTALVARWAANTLAKENHGGIERYFDWSFYSQGSGDDKTASADIFIKEALEFFGDRELAAGNAGGWQKGERLAQLVAEHRSVLILDGLEPLQDAKSGDLRDLSLRALLRGLAAQNRGLCLVTTRQTVPALNMWQGTTAPEWKLDRLSKEAGAELLAKVGVKGTRAEREQLAADVKGHSLTLTLLGKYLTEAHGGDIRRRDLVSLSEADYEETNGHAFHVMEAYETWLEKGGRLAELAILRLLGLFDRPAAADCLAALRQPPAIPGLTDTLIALSDAQWNVAVQRLVKLGLIEEQGWEPRRVVGYSEEEAKKADEEGLREPQPFETDAKPSIRISLDAHPLVREYFSVRLRDASGEAWRLAHARLFEYLQDSVPFWPEGLDGLQPLYQAVAHGCQAGRYMEACAEIYRDRIIRATSGTYAFYSSVKLGAVGANLGATRCFFTEPWTCLSPKLEDSDQTWLFNQVANFLFALVRLGEASQSMRSGLPLEVRRKDWKNAGITAGILSELCVTMGDISSAMRESDRSVVFADRSEGDWRGRANARAKHAYAMHQAGQREAAKERFDEAEALNREGLPSYPLLNAVPGFWYCDLLIASAECQAWRSFLDSSGSHHFASLSPSTPKALFFRAKENGEQPLFEALSAIERRALETLSLAERNLVPLAIALDHLTLGRVELYRIVVQYASSAIRDSESTEHMNIAVENLRQSSSLNRLPPALLSRAWLRTHQGRLDTAKADLDEAEQIAERGPMPLFLADIHLYRARLFFREEPEAARQHLVKARELIFKHGYFRRKEELEDAERVILA